MNGDAMSSSSQVENSLHEQLQVVGLDPTLIVTVIDAVLGILSKCQNKQAARDEMANPSRLARLLIRQQLQKELRETGRSVGRAQLDQLVEQIVQVSRNAPAAERDALLNHTGKFDTI